VSVNARGEPVFPGTEFTHEVVIAGVRYAFCVGLAEAKVVARAVSRAVPATSETRIYAAFATTPHSSYVTGWEVR
jgi:hypothetical protein